MSQTFLNLLNAYPITNSHLYEQVQHIAQTWHQYIVVLQALTDTYIQHNYDNVFASIPIFNVSKERYSLNGRKALKLHV